MNAELREATQQHIAKAVLGDTLVIDSGAFTHYGRVFEFTNDGGVWVETLTHRLRLDADGRILIASRIPERAQRFRI